MEPFASPDQLDPKLLIFLEEACQSLCSWFSQTEKYGPLPVANEFPDVAPNLCGLSKDELLRDLQLIMSGAYRPSHPGALAHFDPPPLTASIVGDLICAGLNNNLLANELSPSLSKLETQLCFWFSQRLGMPPESGGVAASGGTLSNLMALVIARKQADLQFDPDAVVIASADAHISIPKAINIMGLRPESFIKIPTNEDGQICLDRLHNLFSKLRINRRKCFAVVATAGTTVRGEIDPIKELSEFCLNQGIWFHVDASIGGAFALSKATSHLVKGISCANSVAVNPQKVLGISKASSLLLVANRQTLKSTFGTGIPYLEPLAGDEEHGGEIGLQGTRPGEVLKLWIGLRQLGERGINKLLQESIERRIYLQDKLDNKRFEILTGPLHLLALTPRERYGKINEEWSIKTRNDLLSKNFMLSRPLYQGKYYLKIVLGNPHTKTSHLDKLSELINDSLSHYQ